MTCRWCQKDYDKPVMKNKWRYCPHCDAIQPVNHIPIDRPLEGSERWYKERWFRKDDKTWNEDIKSRKYVGDGKTIRVNEKGERIG